MLDCSVDQSAVVDFGFTAAWELLRDGYPWRCEEAVVVDCTVQQSTVICCRSEMLSGKMCDSYAC